MKKNKKKTILGTIIVVLTMVIGVNAYSNDNTTNASNSTQQKVEVKKVGTKRLEKAKDNRKTLVKEKKDKEKEYKKLKDQLSHQKEKAAKAKAKAKKAQEAQEKARQSNTNTVTSTASASTGSSSGGNHGDMNTAATGQIVGNARSHIYHVPGQAGYHMNSSNAVYFNSEQDAINAGYRKALR